MMKRSIWKLTAIAAAILMTTGGCAVRTAGTEKQASAESAVEDMELRDAVSSALDEKDVNVASAENYSTSETASTIMSELFSDRDLSGDYDTNGACVIRLNGDSVTVEGSGAEADGSTIRISAKGVYIVSGMLKDGQILVDAGEEKVQIVLSGADITNNDSACIFVKSADKVFVTLADGTENRLADTAQDYVQTDDESTVDAVIFSKDDLTINGNGTLSVKAGYKHGIVSKDDLKITGGEITVVAANGKGLQGKDSVRIGGGTIDITAGTEGIEGLEIDIAGGELVVKAKDDGLNAANKEDDGTTEKEGFGMMADTDENCRIRISGGSLSVNAEGDGLDSNGYLIVEGGTVIVDGPENDGNGALDAGIDVSITGGTVIATGSGGMAETFGRNSTQYSLQVYFDETLGGGTTVILADENGTEILTATPTKKYSSVVFSSPELTEGNYTVYAGDQTVEVQISEISTSVGNGGFGPGGSGFGGPGRQNGDPAGMPDGQKPDFGDGQTPTQMPDGQKPDFGDGQTPPQMPDGQKPDFGNERKKR
ncbi:MAG: carbohydrate-binding domain-containing protein [Lachnospiraceae bacterium]|nr:carbohydrate-binding domain-containing protein [Lachnospiraceae bacterium]